MEFLRRLVRESPLFNFNSLQRDQWVRAQAEQIPPNYRVLDVGAGSCPYREFFTHCDYFTHDFTALLPEQLRGREGYGTIDYCSDITKIPVSDASFDVILCTEVLEHVPEPIEALREMLRIAKPGGILLLTAPLGSGLHQAPYHYYGGYTPYWYKKFLSELGADVISIESTSGFFRHFGQESIRFSQLLSPWQATRNIPFLPLWILTFPLFAICIPVLGYILDPLDTERAFTVGYFVKARKLG